MSTWYLVLIMSMGTGVTSQQISQVNKAQCEVNAKAYNGKVIKSDNANVYTRAICLVGSK